MVFLKDTNDVKAWRTVAGSSVALVPTMGNLHDGHMALVQVAQQRADMVIVSIFVNPLQFGPREDFASYPRTLNEDLARLQEAGVNAVFAPAEEVLYPHGRTGLSLVMPVASLSKDLCGAARPGHFVGVTTVVAKLFNIIQPQLAVFGEKDFQQLQVVRQMTRDLNFPVQIVAVPTVREADGLAMSSRNAYLAPEERRRAPLLYTTLQDLARRVAAGERDVAALRRAAWETLELEGLVPEYLELLNAADLQPVEQFAGELRWFAAVRLGGTRLIDNVPVNLG